MNNEQQQGMDLISRLRLHGTTYSSSQGSIVAGKDVWLREANSASGRGMEEALLRPSEISQE